MTVPGRPAGSRHRGSATIWVPALLLLLPAIVGLANAYPSVFSSRNQPAAATPVPAPAPPPSPFLQRVGTALYLDGAPYRFVGVNNTVMLGCGHPWELVEGGQREAFFAGLRPRSVVRVWLLPGTDLDAADEVLAVAKRYNHLLVLTLSEAYGYCGDTKKDGGWYAGGFRSAYLDWVRTVVPRYRDDPTLGMWELINEPVGNDAGAMRSFFDAAGGLIKELDPNHLVSSGTLAAYAHGGASAFLHASASAGVDVLSLHEYEEGAGVSGHLTPVLDAARAVGKPVLVGEVGLPAAPAGTKAACPTLERRAELAEAKTRAYLQYPEVAGVLWWSYKARRPPGCDLTFVAGDPLLRRLLDLEIEAYGADGRSITSATSH